IAGPRRMVHGQDNLGHEGRGHRFDKARARTNDSRVLSFRSNHETRDILNEKQRGPVTIAGVDKVSDFLSRLGVDNAAKLWRASCRVAKHTANVCNHADLYAANARMSGDDLFRIVCLKLVEMTFVQQTVQNLTHAIRLSMILRNNLVDLLGRRAGIPSGGSPAFTRRTSTWWQLRNKLSYLRDTLFIILHPIMSHSGQLV